MNEKTVSKVFAIVAGLVSIFTRIQAAGASKKAAVLAAIPDSVALAELAIGKALVNDAEVRPLMVILLPRFAVPT